MARYLHISIGGNHNNRYQPFEYILSADEEMIYFENEHGPYDTEANYVLVKVEQ